MSTQELKPPILTKVFKVALHRIGVESGMSQNQSTLVSVYKILRWVVLAMLVFFIFIALRRPAAPALPVAPEAAKANAQAFTDKLQDLANAHGRGEKAEARFNADEVNAEIAQSMAEGSQPAVAAPVAASAPASGNSQPQATPPQEAEAAIPVRTVQVGFVRDEVTGQFATQVYGKDVYITISGKLGSSDGYVTFDPTGFKFGDLEIPVSWVNDALQKKLSEPENREKLKLPEYVSGLRVENGELVITEK